MVVQRYAALLRGINVGGRNRVPMAELRDAFAEAGCGSVATYIQSGNVAFATEHPAARLEAHLEGVLEQRFGIPIAVVMRSARQMRSVVAAKPPGFGESPDQYHSDVIFLKAPLTPSAAMGVVQVRDGVDRAWAGTGVLYFERLIERRTQSRLSSIMGTPEYRLMTIRNWRTTTQVLDLVDHVAT